MTNKTLIQEELLRIMTEAERWQTIELALNALLTVRRMDKELEREKVWHSGGIVTNNIVVNTNEDEIKKVIKSGVLDRTISEAMSREMNRRGIRR